MRSPRGETVVQRRRRERAEKAAAAEAAEAAEADAPGDLSRVPWVPSNPAGASDDDDADARSAATSAREQKFADLAGEADLVAARLAADLDDWSKQNRVDQAEADECRQKDTQLQIKRHLQDLPGIAVMHKSTDEQTSQANSAQENRQHGTESINADANHKYQRMNPNDLVKQCRKA